MEPIWLFLPTFRKFVRDANFNSEENKLPVFYYEYEVEIWFYKLWEGTLFYVRILQSDSPKDTTIENLKNIEFVAEELPEQLIKLKQFQVKEV